MTEAKAREILGDWINPAGELKFLDEKANEVIYVWMDPDETEFEVDLEGCFSIQQLKAIVWWIKNRKETT